ncbi:hypothetical protein BJ741DRAFT_662329 [Chytriomyces cf. hyalinus JEL632]|nr:hypothetical protein BJ741DRAFT_662329 [Chytriomyces cf. hyalinus JEL632]
MSDIAPVRKRGRPSRQITAEEASDIRKQQLRRAQQQFRLRHKDPTHPTATTTTTTATNLNQISLLEQRIADLELENSILKASVCSCTRLRRIESTPSDTCNPSNSNSPTPSTSTAPTPAAPDTSNNCTPCGPSSIQTPTSPNACPPDPNTHLSEAAETLKRILSSQAHGAANSHALIDDLLQAFAAFNSDCMEQISAGYACFSLHTLDIWRVKSAVLELCRSNSDKETVKQILDSMNREQLLFLAKWSGQFGKNGQEAFTFCESSCL